jgi:hypothetical protein
MSDPVVLFIGGLVVLLSVYFLVIQIAKMNR